MYKLIDAIEFQQPGNYLIDNDIIINDLKVIKEFITSNKRMVNNLKVYFHTSKKANKYKLIPNFLLNRRTMEKMDKYDNDLNFMQNEMNSQMNYLRKLKDYLTKREIISKLENLSYTPKANNSLLKFEILERDSLLINNYLRNTNDFVSKNYVDSTDISRQGYLNDVLDIVEGNISKQENVYFEKKNHITNDEKIIRDIYRESYNNLVKTISCTDEYPDMSKYRYKQDIIDIYKKYSIKNGIVFEYIDSTCNDIYNIYEARTNNNIKIR